MHKCGNSDERRARRSFHSRRLHKPPASSPHSPSPIPALPIIQANHQKPFVTFSFLSYSRSLLLFGNTTTANPSILKNSSPVVLPTIPKMHAFAAFFAVATLFASVLSTPLAPERRWRSFRDYNPGMTSCLQDSDVNHLVDGFALLVNSTF